MPTCSLTLARRHTRHSPFPQTPAPTGTPCQRLPRGAPHIHPFPDRVSLTARSPFRADPAPAPTGSTPPLDPHFERALLPAPTGSFSHRRSPDLPRSGGSASASQNQIAVLDARSARHVLHVAWTIVLDGVLIARPELLQDCRPNPKSFEPEKLPPRLLVSKQSSRGCCEYAYKPSRMLSDPLFECPLSRRTHP